MILLFYRKYRCLSEKNKNLLFENTNLNGEIQNLKDELERKNQRLNEISLMLDNTSFIEEKEECPNITETKIDDIFEIQQVKRGYKLTRYVGFNESQLIIPQKINEIPIVELSDGLFKDCIMLQSVIIESEIRELPENMFSGCLNLKKIVLPNSIIKVCNGAFYKCKSLESMKIPNNVTVIGRSSGEIKCTGVFEDSGIKRIKLPSKIKKIHDNTFYNCSNLNMIDIPSSVFAIGKNAFRGCTMLSFVKTQEGLEFIEDYAFGECINLKKIFIPRSVKNIGNDVFYIVIKIQPDLRYKPIYKHVDNKNIEIYCYSSSYAQKIYRGQFRCFNAENYKEY